MLKHSTKVIAAITILAAGSARAEDPSANTVMATVNGTEITLGHMIVLRAGLPQQYQDLPDNVLFDGILDQLVRQTILAGTIDMPDTATQLAIDNETRTLLAGEAMNTRLDNAITDEALQALYEETFAQVEPTKEFNASHILVTSEEEAVSLIAELEGGADFAELARAKSTGPSGPNGGELGWFGAGMMVKPFEDAVMGMADGEVAGPVLTQFGWHVIKLNESRIKDAPALEEVRDELVGQLEQKAVEALIEEARADAAIVENDTSGIDPAILRDFDLLTQ